MPPTDEIVPVRELLHVSLVDRDERWRVDEAVHERRGLVSLVDAQHEPARLLPELRRRLVVEHRQRSVLLAPHVVLPAEAHATAEREVAALAAETPDDVPGPAVDLVDRVGISRRHEVVAVAV